MDSHIVLWVVAIILLIILSAYFSASETAFTSFNRIRMKNMAAGGNRRAASVLRLSENYDKLLSTILIGNNIVNIGAASVGTLLFVELYGALGVPVSTLVITVAVLIFGEISPKSIAKEIPEKFCLFSAPVIRVLGWVFAPVNFLFSLWKKLLRRVFTLDNERSITEEEILIMVEEAETEGSLEKDQSELIINAIEFNELEAWDVLTPRVEVSAIEIDTPKEEIAELFRETGFSRLPVYDETIDKILGVLNQKDFSNYVANADKEISEFVKPVVFLAGSVKIAAILKKMQKAKTHIAVIVDEYGGTEGIVTMEDIIEELVGEIYDEHDEITTQEIIEQQDGSFRVLCNANVEKMFDYFDMEEESLDVTTVNGWVVVALDKLPEVGDSFEYKGLTVKVTKADEKKSIEIQVTKKDEQKEGE